MRLRWCSGSPLRPLQVCQALRCLCDMTYHLFHVFTGIGQRCNSHVMHWLPIPAYKHSVLLDDVMLLQAFWNAIAHSIFPFPVAKFFQGIQELSNFAAWISECLSTLLCKLVRAEQAARILSGLDANWETHGLWPSLIHTVQIANHACAKAGRSWG